MMDKLEFIAILCLLAGYAFNIYRTFTKPDIQADKEIALMKRECHLKHQYLDENIIGIKENHLKHLEIDVAQLKVDSSRILTILDERLPKK